VGRYTETRIGSERESRRLPSSAREVDISGRQVNVVQESGSRTNKTALHMTRISDAVQDDR
jgi:hypothetical protein